MSFADILKWLYSQFGSVISLMRRMELVNGVNIFTFLIAVAVMGIVISYLLPVARHPSVSSSYRDKRKTDKKEKE